jgi:hypothetical protein
MRNHLVKKKKKRVNDASSSSKKNTGMGMRFLIKARHVDLAHLHDPF